MVSMYRILARPSTYYALGYGACACLIRRKMVDESRITLRIRLRDMEKMTLGIALRSAASYPVIAFHSLPRRRSTPCLPTMYH